MNQKNILLIFTDQQRFDTIEALGNSIIKTPALNRLVESGISFNRAYTPCPVCVPARFSMHTGLAPHRANSFFNGPTPNDKKSFMSILNENGYQTHGVGKMHFALRGMPQDTSWGFESRDYSEECISDDDFIQYLKKNGYDHVYDPHGVRSDMYYIPQPSQLPQRLHHTTWVVDRSIEFLKNRDANRPFMLMTSFIKPHPPFETPTPWNKLYRGPEMPLPKRPADCEDFMTYWNHFQNRYKYRDQGIDDNLFRQIKAAYYCAISFIDYNIGRLLDYMEENNLLDNTLIIFTSDHGEMLGDYNCVGKRGFLDSAARIPMLMVHPDLPKGKICNRPVNLTDIMPTFLEYAGIEPQDDLIGSSLTQIFEGTVDRDITFGQFHRNEYGLYMAVTEQFKYIYSAPDQKEWLFDLSTDPEETRNRAYNPMYIEQREIMKKRIIDYFKKDGYTEPLDGDDWKKGNKISLQTETDEYLIFQDTPESIPNIPGYERSILNFKRYRTGPFTLGF